MTTRATPALTSASAQRLGLARVSAWLERHVEGRTGRVSAGAQCLDFGVRRAVAAMEALSQDRPVAHEDGPDGRVGRRAADGARGELTRPLEVDAVERYGTTSTPRQNATWSAICFAASFGCG